MYKGQSPQASTGGFDFNLNQRVRAIKRLQSIETTHKNKYRGFIVKAVAGSPVDAGGNDAAEDELACERASIGRRIEREGAL